MTSRKGEFPESRSGILRLKEPLVNSLEEGLFVGVLAVSGTAEFPFVTTAAWLGIESGRLRTASATRQTTYFCT